MDLYAENILDHYKNPRRHGWLKDASIWAEDSNPLCGDKIRIDLKLENGKIADIAFSGEGCAISQAATSMLADEIAGKNLQEVAGYENEKIYAMLGVPLTTARVKCALLGLVVFKKALTLNKIQNGR